MRSAMAGPGAATGLGVFEASSSTLRCLPAWQRSGSSNRRTLMRSRCAWPQGPLAATARSLLPISTRTLHRGCCVVAAAVAAAAPAPATAAARSPAAVAATAGPASRLARAAGRGAARPLAGGLHATGGRGRGSSNSSSGGGGSSSGSSSRGGRAQELLGVEVEDEQDEEEAWDDEDEEGELEEGEGEEDEDGAEVLGRSVVQVHTLHRVPNFLRPWEDGHDAESTSSAFVVEVEVELPAAPPVAPAAPAAAAGGSGLRGSRGRSSRGGTGGGARPAARAADAGPAAAASASVSATATRRVRQRLLMTTAGAVEHARKLEVSRSADDAAGPYPASVAAVCLDLDVALLRVDDPRFWRSGSSSGDGGSSSGSAGARERRRRLRAGAAAGGGSDDEYWAADADAGAGADGGGGGGGGGAAAGDEELLPLVLDRSLPNLRRPVVVAGFPLGGAGLCVTSGVVSRIEVVEYSHSGRALLALQVDAPLNNGGWGGPALCPVTGRCVGMAFQKFTSQTWMERYDDGAVELYGGGEDDEEEGGGGGGSYDGGGEDGAPGQDYGDEDAENIGYLVPSQSLALVLEDYCREVAARTREAVAAAQAAAAAAAAAAATAAPATSSRPRGAQASRSQQQQAGSSSSASPSLSSASSASASTSTPTSSSAPLYLDGRPRLGIRYQRMESPALRRAFGLPVGTSGSSGSSSSSSGSSSSNGAAAHAWRSGVLVTGVDPTGSAAGVVQVHDVLLAVGGRPVADDATTALAAPGTTGSESRRQRGQRVLFGHWAAVGRVGQQLSMTVLRQGQVLELPLTLRGAGWPYLPVSVGPAAAGAAAAAAVSAAGGPRRAQFLVAGPLVFAAFTLPYWYQMVGSLPGNGSVRHMGRVAARSLQSGLVPVLGALEWGMPAAPGEEEIVLLVEVLECGGGADDDGDDEEDEEVEAEAEVEGGGVAGLGPGAATGGRASAAGEAAAWSAELRGAPRRVTAVNGEQVRSLAHLAEAIVAAAPAAPAVAAGKAPAAAPSPWSTQFLRLLLEPHPPSITPPPAHSHGAAASSTTSTSTSPSSTTSTSTSSSSTSGGTPSTSGSSIGGTVVVLDCARLAGDTRAVLRHHSMGAAMTPDLRKRLGTAWPFEGGAQGGQSGAGPRGRRQQGRRFAFSGRR